MVVVEGVSDAIAVETLARRMGMPVPHVVPVGGSKGIRRAARELTGERLLGLVDAQEQADFAGHVDQLFVCDPDLEGEFVRAFGADGVLAVIEQQGELASFRTLQRQPAQRGRTVERQLIQFFAGRSGKKSRYAQLLADAMPLDRIPAPIAALLAALHPCQAGTHEL